MTDKNRKTIRSGESTISSGVSKPDEGTLRGDQPVVPSGVAAGATQARGGQVISAGVTPVGAEMVLNGKKYQVLQELARPTGESQVYLVLRDDQNYVFKYYYPNFFPKEEILKQLKELQHEDIVNLIDYGYHEGRFFEVMEYAAGGSLIDFNPDGTYKYLPVRDVTRMKQIIKETVNALHDCHVKGIIHRDIKPDNVFFKNSDGTDILIGDFGISSALEEGMSRRLTNQSLTVGYAAPELYGIKGEVIIGKEIDYYALGLTVVHIWLGKSPFEGLGPHAIINLTTSGKIDIPGDMSDDLKTLVKGLVTIDYRKRWGYEEVQKWLVGDNVPVHYKVVEKKYSDFRFGIIDGEEIDVNDPVELARLLEKYPQQGIKHLYKGTIQRWVQGIDQSLYIGIAGIVEDEYPQDEDAGLKKAIYLLDPGKKFKSVCGTECGTAPEIGDAIELDVDKYQDDLTKNLNHEFYLYLEARSGEEEANTFRKYAKTYEKERAVNTIILELQGRDSFKAGNNVFYKPEEILLAEDDAKTEFVRQLSNPDSKLSIWLEAFDELKSNIDKWKRFGRHNNITISYGLEEKSPFHFKDDLAFSLEDFKTLFAKYILERELQEEMITFGSPFTEEANFWLKKYKVTVTYQEVIREYLEKNISDVDVDICEKLVEYIIDTKPDLDYYVKNVKPLVDGRFGKEAEPSFSFEDIVLIPDDKMKMLSRLLDVSDIALALKEQQRVTFDKFHKNLPMRAQIILEDEWRLIKSPQPKEKIKEARGRIVEKVKGMLKDGKITIQKFKVDKANKLEVEVLKKQERYLEPHIDRLKNNLSPQLETAQKYILDIKAFDFRNRSKEANTIIKVIEQEISLAESRWDENSIEMMQSAGESIGKAVTECDNLAKLKGKVEIKLQTEETLQKKQAKDKRERKSAIFKMFFIILGVITSFTFVLGAVVGIPLFLASEGFMGVDLSKSTDNFFILGIGISALVGVFMGLRPIETITDDFRERFGQALLVGAVAGGIMLAIVIIWNGFTQGILSGLGAILFSPLVAILGAVGGGVMSVIGLIPATLLGKAWKEMRQHHMLMKSRTVNNDKV